MSEEKKYMKPSELLIRLQDEYDVESITKTSLYNWERDGRIPQAHRVRGNNYRLYEEEDYQAIVRYMKQEGKIAAEQTPRPVVATEESRHAFNLKPKKILDSLRGLVRIADEEESEISTEDTTKPIEFEKLVSEGCKAIASFSYKAGKRTFFPQKLDYHILERELQKFPAFMLKGVAEELHSELFTYIQQQGGMMDKDDFNIQFVVDNTIKDKFEVHLGSYAESSNSSIILPKKQPSRRRTRTKLDRPKTQPELKNQDEISTDDQATVLAQQKYALLKVQRTDGSGEETIPLTRNEVIIGRHTKCDITLNQLTISRHHATFSQKDDKWYLKVLLREGGAKTNGAEKVDGEKLPFNTEIEIESLPQKTFVIEGNIFIFVA